MPASVQRLDVMSLRERARAAIRASIVTGELEPGELYTIGPFAQRLGVSATPVREALGDLHSAGLVEVIRNRGFVVPHLTDHDLDETFQIRLMLEMAALVEVAGHHSADDVRECREINAECKDAALAGDLIRFLETDRRFHVRLIVPLGNRRLEKMLGELRDHTRLYGLPGLRDKKLLSSSAQEHEAILNAVVASDLPAVKREIANHIRHTRGAWAGRPEVGATP
jgi:DNA-binding GntR family transcriptional regulator